MRLTPHSDEWYAWLSKKQAGYFYPGKKIMSPWHGDDNFLTLVFEHLRPEMDVLEVGCAQGELALAMAPRCRSVLAYDAMPEYIDLAGKAAAERGITNTKFILHNSRARYNGGQARVPAADHTIDLWVNKLGPSHSILDARRVCRPGAVLLTLLAGGGVPASGEPPAPWKELVPESLQSLYRSPLPGRADPNWAYNGMAQNLAEAGLKLHSWWDFDTSVTIPTPRDWYIGLAWPFMEDEVPPYQEVGPALEQIFEQYAGSQGLEDRWRRSICKVVIPGG